MIALMQIAEGMEWWCSGEWEMGVAGRIEGLLTEIDKMKPHKPGSSRDRQVAGSDIFRSCSPLLEHPLQVGNKIHQLLLRHIHCNPIPIVQIPIRQRLL